jgi:hypothetical protein
VLVQSWAAEAVSLKENVGELLRTASYGDPSSIHAALNYARGMLDRMETLQSLAIAGCGAARRYSAGLDDMVADSFDEALIRERRTGRQEDFVSAQERSARAGMQVLDAKIAARQARLLFDEAREVLDRIRSAYRWTDEARKDLRESLRSVAWEASMER